MKNHSSQFTFLSIRPLFTLCALFLLITTVAVPTTTHALTQYSCADGSQMTWGNGGGWKCTNGTVAVVQTNNVTACADGYSLQSVIPEASPNLTAPPETQQACFPSSRAVTVTEDRVSCGGTWNNILNPGVCLVRSLFAGLGALFMWLGIEIATLAGSLFEFVLQYAIVQFATTLQNIKGGIDTGWSAFRDIANIVIIGAFVFTAINIILGVKEYGEKRMIAKILVIAVLINFSLLFTKIIIDASNFTAYQFYNSMVKTQENKATKEYTATKEEQAAAIAKPTNLSAPDSNPTANLGKGGGIAARFMQLLGVQNIGDSYDVLRKIQETQDNALLGLGYGFLSFLFLFGVAFIFLYGAFLIVTRAVLFVFLMLTSAIAFASWLIPHHIIGRGWATWWETLIKTALFGPILMIFLWMTAVVSSTLSTGIAGDSRYGGGTLGALASKASSEANIAALFSFALILGLLYASFKAASMISNSIAGFSATGGALGLAALTPFAAASRIVGLGARTFVGGRASRGAADLKERIDKRVQNKGPKASMWERTRMRAGIWAGSRTFDPMNTKIAKTAARTVGVGTFGDVVGKGGYIGVKERQARAALEAARKMGFLSAEETRKNAKAAIEGEQKEERDRLAAQHAAHKEDHDKAEGARAPAETEKKSDLDKERIAAGQGSIEDARKQQARLEAERDEHEATYQQELAIQRQRIANAKKGTDEEREARDELKSMGEARNHLIGDLNKDIDEVKGHVTQYDKDIKDAGTDAVKARQQVAQKGMDDAQTDLKVLDKIRDERVEHAGSVGSDEATARDIAASRAGTLYFFGNPANDAASKRVIKAARVRVQREQALRISEAMKEVTGEAAPKAPTPPTKG